MSDADRTPAAGSSGGKGLDPRHIRKGGVARLAIRAIRAVKRVLLLALELVLAAIILFEEWGWQPLSAAIARLARIEIVASLEAGVRALPPWPALGVFLVPSALFLPLKILSLWLIAGGHVLAATGLFVLAKIAGTALYARIFQLTQPALMRLAWFARAYNWFMPWKTRLIEHARATAVWRAGAALSARVKSAARASWRSLEPTVRRVVARVRAAFGF